jgi:2-polyprenyl-3-methyl-5-hydroxy-6-metoxy-1,4-benzoquinol methylase
MSRAPWQPALSLGAWLRWEIVEPRLPTGAERILEVGCGRGGFAVRLADRYTYLGVEPDETSAVVAQQRLTRFGAAGEVRLGDISVVDHDERFDLVCAFEVIEHTEDHVDFVRNCVRPLRPGGLMMLTTPAGRDRFSAADELVGHFRRYDRADLRAVLEAVGLEVLEIRQYGAPLGNFLERLREALAVANRKKVQSMSVSERTARSGRFLQPRDGAFALATWATTLLARKLQLALPGRGTSLLAVARLPGDTVHTARFSVATTQPDG